MKTATVADLRNNFSSVSKWIRDGEHVTITKRGSPFAELSPIEQSAKQPAPPLNRRTRLKRLFPEGPVKGDVQDVLDIERGNR